MQHIKKGIIFLLTSSSMTLLEHQMDSSSPVCFLRNPIPWIPLLLLLPIFTCLSISGSGYFSFLITSLLLIFSAIFHFKFTKQKQLLEEQVQPQPLCSEQSFECQVDDCEIFTNSHKTFQENGIDDCLGNGSPDSYSESEVVDQYSSSEDSDIDWPFSGNVAGSPDFSDGSISDEESLIEIALPSGHYLGSKEDEDEDEDEDEEEEEEGGKKSKWGLQKKCQDFSAEAIFGKRSLMELLAEINDMNEEDNLIEIDISMGSIKCSRFEIEA